jgi:hypothetical protein
MNGTMSFEANQEEPVRTSTTSGRDAPRGDSPGPGGCRSSFLEPPAPSFLRGRVQQIRKRPVEAAGAVDAKNAPTAPWKTAQNAVSHSYHRRLLSLVTGKVLPMFPVNFVTYVPGCTLTIFNCLDVITQPSRLLDKSALRLSRTDGSQQQLEKSVSCRGSIRLD